MNLSDIPNDLAYVIITGAIGSLVAAGLIKAVEFYQIKRAVLTGVWYGEITNKGKVIKRDEYKVKHRGIKLYVVGKRTYPYEEIDRKWDFYGIFKEKTVTGYYNAIDPLIDSFGSVLLQANNNTTELKGYYMTLKDGKIDCVEYKWQRKKT